jgi:L-alanine-DL-glutamate epimerase-like enolase superfamily enzyme
MRLWEETPEILNGQIVVPDRPGLGLKLSAEAIQRYEVK